MQNFDRFCQEVEVNLQKYPDGPSQHETLQLRGPPDHLAADDLRDGARPGRVGGDPVGWLDEAFGQEAIADQGADGVGGRIMPMGEAVVLDSLQEILADDDPKESGIFGD